MIRVIGFDFDGTLVMSNAIKREMFFRVAERFGEVSDLVERILANVKGDRTGIFQAVVDELAAVGRLPEHPDGTPWVAFLVDQYTSICEDAIVECSEVPGAMAALGRLVDQGYSLFVNSATPLNPLCRILGRRRMSGFFRNVYGNEGEKSGNIIQAITEFGCRADQLIFIGDNEADRRAAEETGCHFAGIVNEYSGYSQVLRHPIQDLTALDALIGNIEAGQAGKTFRVGRGK